MTEDDSQERQRETYTQRDVGRYVLDDDSADSVSLKPTAGRSESWVLSFESAKSTVVYDSAAIELTPAVIARLYAEFEAAVVEDIELHVIELFKNETRRELLPFVLDEMGDERLNLADMTDALSQSRESTAKAVHRETPSALDYGVLETENEDANIPHYQRGDNRVVQLLESWDGFPLPELFEGAKKTLIRFFLTEASTQEWYSPYQIDKKTSSNINTIQKNIDALVEAGFLNARPGKRPDKEYRSPTESRLRSYFLELNEAARQAYQQ
jgi:hypothetical protein